MSRTPFVLFVSLCMGCLEPKVLYEVELTGSVTSEDEGPIELWFLHTNWGENSLETHYMIIDTVWLDGPTTFFQDVQVPQDMGTGLSVYGWQDRNEDAEHCRPGTDPELSGLVTVEDYPAHEVELAISLTTPCEGPEGL